METSMITMLGAICVLLAASLLAQRSSLMRQSYYSGIAIWSRWLPVLATSVFLGVLAVNLSTHIHGAGDSLKDSNYLDLSQTFSLPELTIFFLAAPFFLSRVGSGLAGFALFYTFIKLIDHSSATPQLGLYLLMSSATIVVILGDKMPWLSRLRTSGFRQKLREILLVGLAIGASGAVFAGIIKVYNFNRWLGSTLDMNLPVILTLMLLIILFFGWLAVALGFTRHFTLPVLSLPTLVVVSYVTTWQPSLLVMPFAACMALSFATVERRHENRRRATGFSTTYLVNR